METNTVSHNINSLVRLRKSYVFAVFFSKGKFLTWHLDRIPTRVSRTHPDDADPGLTNHELSSQSCP